MGCPNCNVALLSESDQYLLRMAEKELREFEILVAGMEEMQDFAERDNEPQIVRDYIASVMATWEKGAFEARQKISKIKRKV